MGNPYTGSYYNQTLTNGGPDIIYLSTVLSNLITYLRGARAHNSAKNAESI
jgi:hypothetical protein